MNKVIISRMKKITEELKLIGQRLENIVKNITSRNGGPIEGAPEPTEEERDLWGFDREPSGKDL